MGPNSHGGFDGGVLGQAHGGIWMRWSSVSAASECICGGPSMTRAKFWTFRCSGGETRRRLGNSWASSPRSKATHRLWSSPTSSDHFHPRFGILGQCARHAQGLKQNIRAENSHLPVRRREQKLQRFKSPGYAQPFLSAHAAVYNNFNLQRHLISRRTLRAFRADAAEHWNAAVAAA